MRININKKCAVIDIVHLHSPILVISELILFLSQEVTANHIPLFSCII